jgi:cytidylate kinase
MSQKIIITIARQYGSGGRYIGKQLAELLDIPFYDKALIDLAAKESGMDPELFRTAEEAPTGGFWSNLASGFNPLFSHASLSGELSLNDQLFIVQSNVIKDLAEQGSCIIVGRCADYVLQGHPDALHLFIYGREEDRIARLTQYYGVDPAEAPSLIQKTDKRRASYYSYYAGRRWGQAENYDLSINSALLPTAKTAELIATMARLKME